MPRGKPNTLESTLEKRLEIWALMQEGKSEAEAVKEAMPVHKEGKGRRINSRATTLFKEWKQNGWFPPSEAETGAQEDTPAGQTDTEVVRQESQDPYVTHEEFHKATTDLAAQLSELREGMNSLMNLSERIAQPVHTAADHAGAAEYPEAPPRPHCKGRSISQSDRKSA
jgi:hypothetical protein